MPCSSALLIRADSCAGFGSGHILRMIALGQAWQSNGGKVVFVTNTTSESLLLRLRCEGFDVYKIYDVHPKIEDIETLLRLIQKYSVKHVVLDGYHFDRFYVQRLRINGICVAMVEDINQQNLYEPDILLVPGVNAKNYGFCVASWTKKLFGAEYALIRKEFLQENAAPRQLFCASPHILISFGGEDAPNATGFILSSLAAIGWMGKISVILGDLNPHKESVTKILRKSTLQAEVLPPQENMADVFRKIDVLIGAGGGTCWEACLLGIPSFCLAIAENQKPILNDLSKLDVLVYAGSVSTQSMEKVALQLQNFLHDTHGLQNMSKYALQLVDGKGVDRFIYELLECSNEKAVHSG